MDLSKFENSEFDRGASFFKEVLWRVCSALFFQNPLFFPYGPKRALLRLFGAKIGKGVLIKPRVTITHPWKVKIGDNTWIGEKVWLDSLDRIEIEMNVCISQGAYLCTGSHDYRSETFNLKTAPIYIEESAWVCAFAIVAPGVTIYRKAVLGMGSLTTKSLKEGQVYQGNPAQEVRSRDSEK